MRRPLIPIVLLSALGACASTGLRPSPPAALADDASEELEAGPSVVAATLLYLPNRVFDLLDIVRLRLRVGPGFGAGVRATELVDVTLGGWATAFVGLRGPRGEPRIPWPFGFETYAGAELSILDASTEESGPGPGYGAAEIGLGLHLLLIGAEVGVEPLELLDLLVGLALFDPVGDDF
ncbi:MAG: hypothetical protein ACF8XB_12430 [Planctomycetota bacterium JB042]